MGKQERLGWKVVAIVAALAAAGVQAGTAEDIRALELHQARAAIARDRAALEQLFAPDFRIVNPAGAVADRVELLRLLTEGEPAYRSVSWEPGLLHDFGDVVVTVGLETVVPARGPQAGQDVRRRITHVWKRAGAAWQLQLRHATIVTP